MLPYDIDDLFWTSDTRAASIIDTNVIYDDDFSKTILYAAQTRINGLYMVKSYKQIADMPEV